MKDNILEASEEQLLAAYLNSRGINAKFVTKDTKIAHAKSAQYAKWKADHWDRFAREEVELQEADKTDTITVDIPLMIRLFEYAREDAKTDMDLHRVTENLIDIRNKGILTMADYEYIVNTKRKIKEEKKLTALDKFRKASAEREKKHAEIEKKQSKDGSGMTAAIDRLEKHLNKEETVSEVYATGVQGHVSQAALDSIKHKRNVKVNLGTPSYNPKPKTLAKKPSKKASFLSKLLNREDTYQDSYAATQTTGMEVVDLPPEDKVKRKELSKSARMIKSLYKKHNMKEELYDHEKEDKSVATYGKKPTMVKAEKKLGMGENQPQAAAVLTGGKTLTGQSRDTLEIDPVMRKPGPPLDQNKKT